MQERLRGGKPAKEILSPAGSLHQGYAVASGKAASRKSSGRCETWPLPGAQGRRSASWYADIYGHSVPSMLGGNGRPTPGRAGMIIEAERAGAGSLSIGMFTGQHPVGGAATMLNRGRFQQFSPKSTGG